MTAQIEIKPTIFELREAADVIQRTAEFVPVAATSVAPCVENAREVMLALVKAGWLPPRFRTFTSEPDPETGVMVSGLDSPEPDFLVERSVSVLRKAIRCAGVQGNGSRLG